MSKQPESRLQLKIRKALEKEFGGFWIKIHGGPYQSGFPDLLGCVDGLFFALEVKRPGKKATALQQAVIGKITDAGGTAGVVFDVEDARHFVLSALESSETDSR